MCVSNVCSARNPNFEPRFFSCPNASAKVQLASLSVEIDVSTSFQWKPSTNHAKQLADAICKKRFVTKSARPTILGWSPRFAFNDNLTSNRHQSLPLVSPSLQNKGSFKCDLCSQNLSFEFVSHLSSVVQPTVWRCVVSWKASVDEAIKSITRIFNRLFTAFPGKPANYAILRLMNPMRMAREDRH